MPRTPNQPSDVAPILGLTKIETYDKWYKDAAGVTQRYLPFQRAILTVATGQRGPQSQPVLQLLDGPVARYENGRIVIANNPGFVAEIWAAPDPPQEHTRVTTARVPLVISEGIISATVLV